MEDKRIRQKIEYTPEEDCQLDELIDKFKSDDKYNALVQLEAITYIIQAKRGSQRPIAKERLISIIINNRY